LKLEIVEAEWSGTIEDVIVDPLHLTGGDLGQVVQGAAIASWSGAPPTTRSKEDQSVTVSRAALIDCPAEADTSAGVPSAGVPMTHAPLVDTPAVDRTNTRSAVAGSAAAGSPLADSAAVDSAAVDGAVAAEAVQLDEHVSPPCHGDDDQGHLPRSLEGASYLAIGAIAVLGVSLATSTSASLGVGGRFGLAVLVALMGLVTGSGVMAIGDRGAHRLGGLLWAIGTVGLAMAVELFVGTRATLGGGASTTAAGATMVVIGGLLWRNRPLPLQLLVVLSGFAVVAIGAVHLSRLHPSITVAAVAAWIASMLLAVLAGLAIVRPGITAAGTAGVVGVAAGVVVAVEDHAIGFVLATVGVAAAAAAGAMLVRLAHSSASAKQDGLALPGRAGEGVVLDTTGSAETQLLPAH